MLHAGVGDWPSYWLSADSDCLCMCEPVAEMETVNDDLVTYSGSAKRLHTPSKVMDEGLTALPVSEISNGWC